MAAWTGPSRALSSCLSGSAVSVLTSLLASAAFAPNVGLHQLLDARPDSGATGGHQVCKNWLQPVAQRRVVRCQIGQRLQCRNPDNLTAIGKPAEQERHDPLLF